MECQSLIVMKRGEVIDVNAERSSCRGKIHLPRVLHIGIMWSDSTEDLITLRYFDCFQDMGYTSWLTSSAELGRWQGLGTA